MSALRKRKRIVKLLARHVSLVDAPAVPRARFLVAKRRSEQMEDKMKDGEGWNKDGENKGAGPSDGSEEVGQLAMHVSDLDALSEKLPDELGQIVDGFLDAIEPALEETNKKCGSGGRDKKKRRTWKGMPKDGKPGESDEAKAKRDEEEAKAAIEQAFKSPAP